MNKYNEAYITRCIQKINSNYIKFLVCIKIYQKNIEYRNIDLLWKESASENLEIMNKYKNIFSIFDFWMLDLSIIELYKFFENRNDIINIYSIINYIYEHRNKINRNKKEKFENKCISVKKWLPDYYSLETVKEIQWYPTFIEENFKIEADKKIENIKELLRNLKWLRHNKSHNLKKIKNVEFNLDDFDKIQKTFEELFNFINLHFENWTYDYSLLSIWVEQDYDLLFQNLSQFHKIRSLFFDNFWKTEWESGKIIYKEIKDILSIDF